MSVSRGEYDMLTGDITITSERVKIVDFSIPIQSANVILFMNKEKNKEIQVFSFLQPLSNSVWIAIFISLCIGKNTAIALFILFLNCNFLVTFVIFLTQTVSKEPSFNCSCSSLLLSFWFSLASLLGYGIDFK